MQESRQHPRFAVDVTVELITGEEMVAGRCRNVSRGGLCVLGDRALPPGTSLTARIALRFDTDALSEPLELRARVVWCTAIGEQHQLGIAFLPPTAAQAEALEVLLRYIEEGHARERAAAEPAEPDDPFAS